VADAPRFDPRRLRPGELCRILNSTPLGEVTSERVLQRHRNRAGLRIDDGTGKGIDLFRYVAWLAVRRERGAKQEQAIPPGLSWLRAPPRAGAPARRAASRSRAATSANFPRWPTPRGRLRCRSDFRTFCERYFPQTFRLAWSDDHLRVIGRIENAVLEGGLFAMAMPRGSGKTSLCETACPLVAPLRAPGVRGPHRQRRGARREHARVDQGRAREQRPPPRRLPRGVLPHPLARGDPPARGRAAPDGQADAHRVDRTARSCCRRSRGRPRGRRRARRRDHRPHPRHEAQAPRRREHPSVARPDRRPADRRERTQPVAVRQPRAHPRGRRARPRRTGA
jgi:hypothetical protein